VDLYIYTAALYPFVPESPRLLYCQKKYKRAAEILNTVRRINGDEPIPDMENFLEKMGAEQNQETVTLGVVSMFKEKNLLRLMICMSVLFTVNDYFYFAGLLNAANLAGNMFLNQALLALTELPSVFIGQYIIDRFGRRWSHALCMLITTGCFLGNLCVVEVSGMEGVVLGLSLTAKAISNISWFCMWVQCIEVFPTCVRNTGINISVVISTAISMTAPFTIEMDSIDKRLPYVVFVVFGFLGIMASVLVPETKGISLPETVEQVNELFRRFKLFQLRAWTSEKGKPEEVEELKQIDK
jgi:OCT family organic cation transporter-like MFS transporter 4/5